MTIRTYLAEERDLLVPFVQKHLELQQALYAKLTPEYARLLQHLDTYLVHGGKWHRPIVSLLAFRAAGGQDMNAARQASIALELVHRFLLIHDDVIDRDLTRHGHPTIEKIYQDSFHAAYPSKIDTMYSKGNAIVAGDVVFSMAYDAILHSSFPYEVKTAAVGGLNQLMMETGAGWQLQMEQNYKPVSGVTEDDFFTGMQLVSAQYSVVWPLRMGQLFAGKKSQSAWDTNLDTYGWHTGAAFQITDDILGMFGSPEKTGKPVGHDYREGKKTFLVLDSYEAGSQGDRQFIEDTLGTDVDELTLMKVQDLMVKTGALEASKERAAKHVSHALTALDSFESQDAEATDLLRQLCQLLADRSA